MDLVPSGRINLDVQKTEPVTVKRVSVSQDEQQLYISGTASRTHQRAIWNTGHVDIRITSPDGGLIAKRTAGFHRRRLTRHVYEGTFTTRFDEQLPEDATAEVTHHKGGHNPA